MKSVASFPRYWVTTPPERTLALLQSGRILTEQGEMIDATDWQGIKDALAQNNLLLLTPPLARAPWLATAVSDPAATTLLADAGVAGIRVQSARDRRRYHWIIPVSSWFPGELPQPEMLGTLRRLFTLCAVGVAHTPSGLGLALMRRDWQGRPMFRPNRWTWNILHTAIVGGRVDTPQQGKLFPVGWGQDMTGAYLHASRSVPAGTSVAFEGAPPPSLPVYYQSASVAYPDRVILLGPLPMRDADTRVHYYTDRLVHGWFWSDELAEAERLGCRIWRGEGYGWTRTTDVLAPWAGDMHRLRLLAGADRAVAGLVKRAGVSALGRFGVAWTSRRLVPARDGLALYVPSSGPADACYGIEETDVEKECMLLHAISYIHMQVRMATYRRALPYAERGSLIATNFDEILLAEEPLEPPSVELGDWKHAQYTNLIVRHPRWKEADGITPVRPGVRRTA